MDQLTNVSLSLALVSCLCSRRKGDYVFLVAIYECYENHALENAESNRLYCSKSQWVGSRPVCVQIEGTDGDIENEIEEVGESKFEITFHFSSTGVRLVEFGCILFLST